MEVNKIHKMIDIGKLNVLKVVKEVEFGIYLDGGKEFGEILLPKRYVPENCQIDDEIEVFIYLDSEDRIIATTEMPYAMVGDFVLLKVVAVNKIGAFLDWGLQKDLLVPFREQKVDMEQDRSYVVYIYLDGSSNRIAASSKLDKFLDESRASYQEGDEVDIMIYQSTDLGYRAIVEKQFWGMLYKSEVFQALNVGDKLKAYVNKVREDNKIDLSLHKLGFRKVDDFADTLLQYLEGNDGYVSITDKSSSDMIYDTFSVSKKTFKKAVGNLYKRRLIKIENDGLYLTKRKGDK